MHKFEFTPDDLFINRLKTYAEYNVFIYQSKMSINRGVQPNGSGGLVVYDINANRSGTDKVYPFVESGSTKPIFKRQVYQPLLKSFSSEYQFIGQYWSQISGASKVAAYGDGIIDVGGTLSYTSSYGSESPIKRNLTNTITQTEASYFNLTASGIQTTRLAIPRTMNITASALQNVARKYTTLSNHFIFVSSSIRSRDLVYDSNDINFITIPSMYYGSTIKKGSVELNYYITGSKIATCADTNHNGTLIGTTGSTSGSVVGLVLYDEGIIMLTSSVSLETTNGIEYKNLGASIDSSWLFYGTSLNDGIPVSTPGLNKASYDLNFKGTNYINTMTMFAHARKGHLNHSNNPTYRDLTYVRPTIAGSGTSFSEGGSTIANVVSASYVSASFEKTTYISKVHIYDEDGNLIAITSMAKPIKKTLTDEFTFKMKLDL